MKNIDVDFYLYEFFTFTNHKKNQVVQNEFITVKLNNSLMVSSALHTYNKGVSFRKSKMNFNPIETPK